MSDELKPCPFCGGKAYIHEHYTFGGYVPNDYPHNEPLGYAIGCGKYDCRGKRENTGFMYDTEAQAIAAWNTRAERTCKPTEEDCCPICGEDLVKCNVGIGTLGGAVELDPPIYHNYCPNCGRKVVE